MDDGPAEFDLDLIGVLEGTDKSSALAYAWDYLRHYQSLFAPWRDEPINFIEIGVAGGSSLNVWTRYFTSARIVGIDIDPSCRRFARERVAIEIGSQEDPAFLHQVCAKYPPSIIVDDGSHLARHMVYSFERLFPLLLPGGLYVVEDLEFQFGRFGPQWAGDKSISAPDYFLRLARDRMANNTPIDELWGDDRYIRDHVDAISFMGSLVAIRKKQPRDMASAVARAERFILSTDTPGNQLPRLAQYILRHDGPLELADRALRAAESQLGRTSEMLPLVVDILSRQGRLDDAAKATEEATRLRPNDHTAWAWHAHVERHRGRAGAAIAALEKVTSLDPRSVHAHDQLSRLLEQQGDIQRALAIARVVAHLDPGQDQWQRRVDDLERRVTAGKAG